MRETWVRSLDQEAPLEKEMATHSSILARTIPMDREAGQATVHGVTKESDAGGRREEGSGWGTHVYLWWIHFDIWQN